MHGNVMLISIGCIVVLIILGTIYFLNKKGEMFSEPVYYKVDRAYVNDHPLYIAPLKYDWSTTDASPTEGYEEKPSYYNLSSGYTKTRSLQLPPVEKINDMLSNSELDEDIFSSVQSGMQLTRGAFKMGNGSRPLKGSYGVGYTAERGVEMQ